MTCNIFFSGKWNKRICQELNSLENEFNKNGDCSFAAKQVQQSTCKCANVASKKTQATATAA